jgi:hypothetical protein
MGKGKFPDGIIGEERGKEDKDTHHISRKLREYQINCTTLMPFMSHGPISFDIKFCIHPMNSETIV